LEKGGKPVAFALDFLILSEKMKNDMTVNLDRVKLIAIFRVRGFSPDA
jgi:hypothetical protein